MKVCVLGVSGFIGRNICQGTDWIGLTRQDLNLLDQKVVEEHFQAHHYDVVIHCAASIDQVDESTMRKNILMFENVVRVFNGKLLYFSSGAAVRGNPPTDPYGLSKWIIDRRIKTIQNAHSLRIWGCYGSHELSTRFSAVCEREGHVSIDKDRYFDFIDVKDVQKVVHQYIDGLRDDKEVNLVYPEVRLLSQWAEIFGATYEIKNTSELGESYISQRIKLM